MKRGSLAFLGLLGLAIIGCRDEDEVTSDCFPAVVIDQGCGTVLGILDTRAAELIGEKPKNDTVFVNTFNLHPIYQVPGKKLFITFKVIPPEDAPRCPELFIPVVFPHIKVLSTSESACN